MLNHNRTDAINIDQCTKRCDETAGCHAVEYYRFRMFKGNNVDDLDGMCLQCNTPSNVSYYTKEQPLVRNTVSLVYKKQGIHYIILICKDIFFYFYFIFYYFMYFFL